MKEKLTIGLAILIVLASCSNNDVTGESEETVAETSSSTIPLSSEQIPVSTTNASSGQMSSSMKYSSSQATSSSLSQTAASSVVQVSSAGRVSSSSFASSSSRQALQFMGRQVRLPDGCGVIQWMSGDEVTCVQDIWVDTTEVTIGSYQSVTGRGVSSLFHNGYYKWPDPSGVGYADDGSPCPECPVDAVTLYEAILYANAMTKTVLHSDDTVYSYTGIDSVLGSGVYQKVKGQEITGLRNLIIDTSKSGFRLPTHGEFHYMCLKGSLINYPWEDLYPANSGPLYVDDLYAWTNQNSKKVTHPVATKLGTSWHLYDLLGNVDEWTTTPDPDYPGGYMAFGGSAMLNGDIFWQSRFDSDRAGFRLVRGKRVTK